jgi:hypothetical protein
MLRSGLTCRRGGYGFRACAQGRASRNDESFYVNSIFTTFMRVRFTNTFDVIAENCRRTCVWRACIGD